MAKCPSCGRPTSANKNTSAAKRSYNIPVPPKPQLFTKGSLKVFLVGLGMLLLSLLLLFAAPDKPEFSEDPITFLMFAVIGIIGGLMFVGVPFLYCLELRDYLQATKDYDGYVKRRTEEIESNQEKIDAYQQKQTLVVLHSVTFCNKEILEKQDKQNKKGSRDCPHN